MAAPPFNLGNMLRAGGACQRHSMCRDPLKKRWCDCPPEYGPPTTIYNRFVRWARRGIWENLFRELAGNGRSVDTQMINSTHVKAHRSASGGEGGSRSRLLAARAEGATRRSTPLRMLKGGSSPSC